jgi:hypothetical protein
MKFAYNATHQGKIVFKVVQHSPFEKGVFLSANWNLGSNPSKITERWASEEASYLSEYRLHHLTTSKNHERKLFVVETMEDAVAAHLFYSNGKRVEILTGVAFGFKTQVKEEDWFRGFLPEEFKTCYCDAFLPLSIVNQYDISRTRL